MKRMLLRHQPWAAPLALLLLLGCGSEVAMEGGPEPSVETGSDPGTITLHRLNRTEYNNTVRDLLGTTQAPADEFPADDTGYGFDNIADVLSLSPLHLELYERAAQLLIDEALTVNQLAPERIQVEAESEQVTASAGQLFGAEGWNLFSNGEVVATVQIPSDGDYEMQAQVYGDQAGPDPVRMAYLVDGLSVGEFEVVGGRDVPERHETTVELAAGNHLIGVAFLNDYYDEAAGADRNLIVDWFAVEGPIGLVGDPNPLRERLVQCEPSAAGCVREVVEAFATRAWRRPPEPAEIDALVALTEDIQAAGDDVEVALSTALQAILVSPHFVFRVEVDPDPSSTRPHLLDDYELASRLSYFLWSSMPDQELFDLAAAGQLQDPEVIAAQVRRMLADERSEALVASFAHQWLYIRDIANAFPDIWVYPNFDEDLRAAMVAEMEHFFQTFVREDRSMLELLTANEVFVNERLAQHYGIDGVDGTEFQRVQLDNEGRGGVLTQSGLLTVLSTPTRTSVVRRGKWVLGQLLCDEPEPPPPGVEGLVEQGITAGTLRERMEQHRTIEICAACHDTLDPIGFALENYDGIGTWRAEDDGTPIDSTGELPDGRTFDGAWELSQVIAEDEAYPACVAEKLFTYALGRGPEGSDLPYLESITRRFADGGHRFEELAIAIATSDPFRFRRGSSEE